MRKDAPIPPHRVKPDAIARPRQQRSRTDGTEPEQRPSERAPRLPHERDESLDSGPGHQAPRGPTEVIEQAAADVRRGLVDTERRGTPSDLPGPRRRAPAGASRRRRS
jgi:hypothetical protein